MSERTEKDIDIKDLPPEETLTPEEKERLAGAGRFPAHLRGPGSPRNDGRQCFRTAPCAPPRWRTGDHAGHAPADAGRDARCGVCRQPTGVDLNGQDLPKNLRTTICAGPT